MFHTKYSIAATLTNLAVFGASTAQTMPINPAAVAPDAQEPCQMRQARRLLLESMQTEAGSLSAVSMLGKLPNMHYFARPTDGRIVKGHFLIMQ